MAERQKTGGRTVGTPNKVTGAVKENFLAVFTRLGGTAAMAEWAQENLTEFYKLYARLIPADVKLSGDAGNPLHVIQTIRREIVKSPDN
jgi:uncharacterized MAPEG superfamily protein